jgi:hypothetical protein
VFGSVTSGMEVVDAIAASAQVSGTDGHISRDNQPVISSIKVTADNRRRGIPVGEAASFPRGIGICICYRYMVDSKGECL